MLFLHVPLSAPYLWVVHDQFAVVMPDMVLQATLCIHAMDSGRRCDASLFWLAAENIQHQGAAFKVESKIHRCPGLPAVGLDFLQMGACCHDDDDGLREQIRSVGYISPFLSWHGVRPM